MNNEREIIKLIDSILPTSALKKSKCMESDAEIFELNGEDYLFTTDEFSAEDLFRENDPYTLGWNIAASSISDIFAAGGKPLFYSHAMTLKPDWDESYIKNLTKGIAAVLKKTGVVFLGGDLGSSPVWRYTASVIGKAVAKPLSRKGAAPGDLIYITGKIGMGNLEAALKLYSDNLPIKTITSRIKNRFQLRNREVELISKFATSCLDTSDGVLNGLQTICELNNRGFAISDLPYLKQGLAAAKLLNMPKTLLFMGECGEYELLFTVNPESEDEFLESARKAGLEFFKLGSLSDEENKQILTENNCDINFAGFELAARNFADVKQYLKELKSWIEQYKETK